jgi:hypothetical protein
VAQQAFQPPSPPSCGSSRPLHGQRGYIIYLPSATANDDAEDQRIFDGIRQSFRFTS